VPKQENVTENSAPQSPEVCVVEASAGSGKTFELAGRYLRLLFDSRQKSEEIQLKNILALTFTNKACIEMKARILKFLKQFALDQFDKPDDKITLLSKVGAIDEKIVRSKAFLAMEEVLKRYNYFQVQTIDSFINAILCGCAFKLDLSSDFRIKNDYREYLAYSFDAVIDQANDDPKIKEQFHQFLDNYLHLENRKSWFPKDDIIEIMGSLLSARNNFGLEFSKFNKELKEIRAKRVHIKELM
jgi:ATP-dependent exoDNAse (exonuclease V) beta subunit